MMTLTTGEEGAGITTDGEGVEIMTGEEGVGTMTDEITTDEEEGVETTGTALAMAPGTEMIGAMWAGSEGCGMSHPACRYGGYRDRPPRRGYEDDGPRGGYRPPPEPPAERPRLQLQPRSKPPGSTDETDSGKTSSIFGGARPVDTATKEQEIEERKKKEEEEERARKEVCVLKGGDCIICELFRSLFRGRRRRLWQCLEEPSLWILLPGRGR